MKQLSIALLLAAGAILAGCKSNESKPEEAAPPPAAAAAPAPAPVAAKPECPPEPASKKKGSKDTAKAKSAKKGEPAAVDCEPAKPKTAANTKAAEPAAAPAAAAASAPAKEAAKPAEAGKPRMMKSRDGTFEGEVYGNIPPNSKWAKLQIGMQQSEVERILGVTSNIRGYVTAKAWIPFYYGTDSHRYEAVYAGQGSVAYTGGGMGGGQGVLMMINYDPKIQ
jgi:hypothetical protein